MAREKKTKIYLSGRMSGLPADTWRWGIEELKN